MLPVRYGLSFLKDAASTVKNVRTIFGSVFKPKYDLGKCSIITEPGNVSPERSVPDHIQKPNYYFEPIEQPCQDGLGEIKTKHEIAGMRKACKIAANILKSAGSLVKVGLTTDEIDAFVHEAAIKANAYPSPLRYLGFPKSVCTSVNNVAAHGIPDDRPLQDGDIINIDVTVYYEGFHGDCSRTFLVGNVDERGKYVVEVAEECLNAGIKACAPSEALNKIGREITRVSLERRLNVFPQFIGHGIGSYFHGPPEVLPYANNLGGLMQPGMTFTIEPIITLGKIDLEMWEDGWTVVSVDGARSAQFEHTILITEDGYEILTLPD